MYTEIAGAYKQQKWERQSGAKRKTRYARQGKQAKDKVRKQHKARTRIILKQKIKGRTRG